MRAYIALVTGVNRGLGLETCRQLAQRGLQVVLSSQDATLSATAAETLRQEGGAAGFHPLDAPAQSR